MGLNLALFLVLVFQILFCWRSRGGFDDTRSRIYLLTLIVVFADMLLHVLYRIVLMAFGI